ncbi:putative amastin-like surface protein [Leishmania mexicana MHOM/GT/2001/U1103]|uniref:Amastin-like surface protein n=1 Tax=Leishmania mexicana (strain MHOM/GT/2001/U1103) TaxID=929439 RepID=E9B4R8_LEIMU|nr:putative amastin-like surface protein [Leishmania mexicana MHOM/GT/2001/U1103]CBZ30237.1 putative amastin-like surface protein [Leishmania mexicana MHOM/GT/2001/U1103]
MAYNINILIYVVLQFIAFVFVLVATPIDMFRGRNGLFLNFCLTLWGIKWGCSNTSYHLTSEEVWVNCSERRNRFRAAEGLAVISIVLYGAAFVLGAILLFSCPLFRWVCLVLNILGMLTVGIVWVAMVLTYYVDEHENCPEMKLFFNYGAGFALFVIAWCLDIINIVFLMIRCDDQRVDANEHPELLTRPGGEEVK